MKLTTLEGIGRAFADQRDEARGMMTSTDPWEAATWEGARRARIRRSLELSVQERLEVLEALAETSARLMEIGREARAREGHPSGHSNEPDR